MLKSFRTYSSEGGAYSYEFIVVNNGGDLRALALNTFPFSLRIIETQENLGYAAGVNLGVSNSSGEILFLMNADLMFHRGSMASMLESLEKFDVVGPQFFWDYACEIYLPPTERSDFIYEVLKVLSGRSAFILRMFQMMWHNNAYKHVLAKDTLVTCRLSGACLGIRRSCWDGIGSFDQGFKLYFEEVDWLSRLRALGYTAVLQPAAKLTHFYNQSSKQVAHTQAWFTQSAAYYSVKHHSRIRRAFFHVLRRGLGSSRVEHDEVVWQRTKDIDQSMFAPLPLSKYASAVQGRCFLEISIFKSFVPAAIALLSEDILLEDYILPGEIWDNLEPSDYYFRIVDAAGRKLLPLSS